ncbi:glycoside hydrolase family 35 protein [Vagococcus acidifermentans]|uniref:Beta-galactosidase n=1 Tax=Vagococcus acidifermentans TaxID=564710 RepID=A0A430AY17_9ENTE|nr:beta-galactosidase family protein [Vagococcus acidifermentans]RSU12970.1 beta-galactosidase [Vagococcus acidifermentans]
MKQFEITDDFYLNGYPFKIISGAIHYFRVVPEYWHDRLQKLKMLGCNTVETYIPWNMHEPQEGAFDFTGILDIRSFVKIAGELDLFVILRPSPYICAEWEFGGLPYWLLQYPELTIRQSCPLFMQKVGNYFDRLFKEIGDLQLTAGGPVIMMQIENEYGSYSNDLHYLNSLADMMIDRGVTVPLVTSDGPWGDMLENGSLPDRALATINCGSDVKQHFKRLKQFHGRKKPLMVMEFWIGWFDAWEDSKHHQTSVTEAANELDAILSEGSVNIYMFHGGTNFGFMNGSNYYDKLTPDVTSYDYDALVTEWGELTPKYEAFRKVIGQYTDLPEMDLVTDIVYKSYDRQFVSEKVSLFESLEDISSKVTSVSPVSMECLNQGTGYIYYKTEIDKAGVIEDFRLLNCMDRAQIFVNGKHLATQLDQEIGEKLTLTLAASDSQLGILVENMGRVNYSAKMLHQKKGISDGVLINGALHTGWDIYSLPMTNLQQLDFSKPYEEGVPAFYKVICTLDEVGDTFINMTGWGKGFVVINGFNIGRFWSVGPQQSLYIPAPLLRKGENELIIFETEGVVSPHVTLTDTPNLG